jgi:hypothetical protein
MKQKKAYKIILNLVRDWLFIAMLGNVLVMFMIPWDVWSLKIVLSNCMFSIGIGYPAMKGMAWIYQVYISRERLSTFKEWLIAKHFNSN